MVAMGIDSVAGGVFLPALTIVLLATTHLRLAEVGSALSIAGVLALPVGLWAGGWVDRVGPRRVLMASNVVQALGVTGYLVFHSFWGVVASACLASAGRGVFFGTYGVAVSAMAAPGERERWFARISAIRNLGNAGGGALAGAMLSIGTHAAYAVLLALTATSLLAAVPFMTRVPGPSPQPARGEGFESASHVAQGWSTVLRDGRYWIVTAHLAVYYVSAYVLPFAVPVFAVVVLGLPGWVAGATFTLNTLLVGFGQSAVVRRLEGRVRSTLLVSCHVLFAIGYAVLLSAAVTRGAVAIGVVMAGVTVYTFGELVGWPVCSALGAEAAPAELRGRYLAFYQFAGSGVGAVAPSILSGLLALGAAAVWLPMMGVCAVGCGLARLAGDRVPAASLRIGQTATPATLVQEG